MKITESNSFDNTGTLTVPSDDDTTQTKADMETVDFSEKYTSLGSSATFSIQKTFAGANRFTCGYVAIAGHNFGDDGGSVEVSVKGVSQGSVDFSDDNRNSVVLFAFTEVTLVDDIDIVYTKGTSTNQITITHIAAGTVLEVPNDGEMSGYPRPWLTKSQRQRVRDNEEAGPVLSLVQQISRRQTLRIRNMLTTFAEADWRDFLDFAASTAFFIREQDTNKRSSYLCFDATLQAPTANPNARALTDVLLTFQVFTGT